MTWNGHLIDFTLFDPVDNDEEEAQTSQYLQIFGDLIFRLDHCDEFPEVNEQIL